MEHEKVAGGSGQIGQGRELRREDWKVYRVEFVGTG